jgi:hypothetical protein
VSTSVIVSVSSTPVTCVVDVPKLLRMSLRTIPNSRSAFEAAPSSGLDASAGYGPADSAG